MCKSKTIYLAVVCMIPLLYMSCKGNGLDLYLPDSEPEAFRCRQISRDQVAIDSFLRAGAHPVHSIELLDLNRAIWGACKAGKFSLLTNSAMDLDSESREWVKRFIKQYNERWNIINYKVYGAYQVDIHEEEFTVVATHLLLERNGECEETADSLLWKHLQGEGGWTLTMSQETEAEVPTGVFEPLPMDEFYDLLPRESN